MYLPSSSTCDRLNICNSVIFDIWSYRGQYPEYECLIAGDMNSNFDSHHVISSCINNFIVARNRIRCETAFNNTSFTYVNEALKQQRTIVYALYSNMSKLINFDVIDPAINLSDHLPLLVVYTSDMSKTNTNVDDKVLPKDEPQIPRFI